MPSGELLVSFQPTKPPQLLVLLPNMLPSKAQPVMVKVPPVLKATKPPWVPSPLTLLLMVTLLRQLVIVLLPWALATKPAANFFEVLIVPATRRLLISAPWT